MKGAIETMTANYVLTVDLTLSTLYFRLIYHICGIIPQSPGLEQHFCRLSLSFQGVIHQF